MAIIGIDLGTTNSAVSVLKNGHPEIIPNKEGGRVTPSIVQMNFNGEIIVGQEAKDSYPSLTSQTVLEVKRLMGSEEKVSMGEESYRAEEISAHILTYLKKSAEEMLAEEVTEAVVTVPAYFSDAQRKATQKAGELAGFKVDRLINEPTAAAMAFGFENVDKNQHLLVYDLGGGTFDVSIVEMFNGVLQVKSSAGNNELGGMDFDKKIVDWITETFEKEKGFNVYVDADESEQLRREALLKEAAEKAKKTLSAQTVAKIQIPFLGIHENAPISIDLELSRAEFEKLIDPLVKLSMKEVEKALTDAGLDVSDVSEILLVGGSTRIPCVQETVENKFNRTPLKTVNPDEAVALGAAIQGGIKEGTVDKAKGLVVIDVCPYTLGVEVSKYVNDTIVHGYFDEIIPRNETIPVTETKPYYTMEDNQTEVKINIYQGENPYVKDNILLADDMILKGVPEAPAGEETINVTFEYDINGILQVEAVINSTGKKIQQAIQSQKGVMSDVEVSQSQIKIADEWDHSDLFSRAKSTIYKAEKRAEQLEGDQKQKMEKKIEMLHAALKEGKTEKVRQRQGEVTDLLIEYV
ncbi:Hsp70 family protein [Marinococcus sp. PL1-022]|uniref:Hsp70 family protein n=1 Tax=Marinococcus sp. PL1-022 TaxID=3095363 RepID=UPI0029C30270|nr:Hsp70 family protein [Marinococcus sp. PL1-022]MDX6153934.1 Hsp70 family protein [Marinococcus sp. PL1-022]